MAGVPEVQALVRGGAVRLLGIMGEGPSPVFPDVPTFRDEGLDLLFEAWGGFMMPRGVAAPILARLEQEVLAAFQQDTFATYCRTAGLDVQPLAVRGVPAPSSMRKRHATRVSCASSDSSADVRPACRGRACWRALALAILASTLGFPPGSQGVPGPGAGASQCSGRHCPGRGRGAVVGAGHGRASASSVTIARFLRRWRCSSPMPSCGASCRTAC